MHIQPASVLLYVVRLPIFQGSSALDVLGLQPETDGELNAPLHRGSLRLGGNGTCSRSRSSSSKTGSWVFLAFIHLHYSHMLFVGMVTGEAGRLDRQWKISIPLGTSGLPLSIKGRVSWEHPPRDWSSLWFLLAVYFGLVISLPLWACFQSFKIEIIRIIRGSLRFFITCAAPRRGLINVIYYMPVPYTFWFIKFLGKVWGKSRCLQRCSCLMRCSVGAPVCLKLWSSLNSWHFPFFSVDEGEPPHVWVAGTALSVVDSDQTKKA